LLTSVCEAEQAMGGWVMGQMGHFLDESNGSWVVAGWPMTHHCSTANAGQMPPTEKLKISHLIGFSMLEMAQSSHQHLIHQHLQNHWMNVYWTKFENMRLSLG